MAFGKKSKHAWEYLPHFQISEGMVVCVQVCNHCKGCRWIRVPSMKKYREMEMNNQGPE